MILHTGTSPANPMYPSDNRDILVDLAPTSIAPEFMSVICDEQFRRFPFPWEDPVLKGVRMFKLSCNIRELLESESRNRNAV